MIFWGVGWQLGGTMVQWVVLLPHSFRVMGLILSLVYCLCGVSHALSVFTWVSSSLYSFLSVIYSSTSSHTLITSLKAQGHSWAMHVSGFFCVHVVIFLRTLLPLHCIATSLYCTDLLHITPNLIVNYFPFYILHCTAAFYTLQCL